MKRFLCYSLLLVCLNSFSQSDTASVKSATSAAVNTNVLTDSMLVNNIPDSLLKKKSNHVYELISVEVSPGFILPAGNFASGDHNNILAGYAKEGFSIGANVFIKVIDKVNVMMSYNRQMNSFDKTSFEANALKGMKNYSLNVNSSWVTNFIMVGGSGNIALDENNFLTPRLLFGFCIAKTPSYERFATKTSAIGTPVTVDAQREIKFAFRIGVGLRKYLNKFFYLSLNPDFYHTTLKKNINQVYFPASTDSYQTVSIINLNVGIGFRMY